MEEKKENVLSTIKNKKKVIVRISLAVIAFLLVTVGIAMFLSKTAKSKGPTIVSQSTLQDIVNVSELSTYTAIHNGVVTVMNEKSPEKIDYHVSYEATVNVGIDFSKIQFFIDETEKNILVDLPDFYITDINVDSASLDYIFINSKTNSSGITATAYQKCQEDATIETEKTTAVFELAEQNAQSTITALIKPFLEYTTHDYTLSFK